MTMIPMHRLAAAVLSMTVGAVALAGDALAPAKAEAPPPSEVSFQQAAAAGKHLFILFFAEENEATKTARKMLDDAMAKRSDVALQISVQKDAPEEMALLTKYRIDTAPMPLVLVLAPNGVVTLGCLGQGLTEEKARMGIASPAQQRCLKALEEKRQVVLCAVGKGVSDDAPALKGIRDFKADPKNASVEVVRLDPTDNEEAGFAKQLNIDSKAEMTTLVLAPPRALLKRLSGEVTKEGLTAALKAPAPG